MVDIRISRRWLAHGDPGPRGHLAGVQVTRRAAAAISSQPRRLHEPLCPSAHPRWRGLQALLCRGIRRCELWTWAVLSRSMVGLPTAPGPSTPNVTVEQGTWDPN